MAPLLSSQVVDTFLNFPPISAESDQPEQADLNATVLTQIALAGKAFDWLNDPAEDGIYMDSDGEPI